MVNDRVFTLLTRKFAGEATPTELEELDHCLAQQQIAPQVLQDLYDHWRTENNVDQEFLEATYLQHLERMKSKGITLDEDEGPATAASPKFSRKHIVSLSIAAAVLLFVITAAWMYSADSKENPLQLTKARKSSQVVAQHGARTKIQLPDGSNVWLNSGSYLQYGKDFGISNREVELTGEAFFDVIRNPSQPFIIHTPKIDVRVLGTRFNIKAYDNDATTETSLIKGSVEVFLRNAPSRKYLLRPNEKLVLQNNSLATPKKGQENLNLKEEPVVEIKELTYINGSQVDVETSWTKNILSFEDESFLDVAHKMERWYNVSFEFKNKKWQQQFLSGSFENETLEQAMTALKFSNGFNYAIKDNRVTIY